MLYLCPLNAHLNPFPMANKEDKVIFRRLLGSYVSSIVSITLVLLLVAIASMLLVNAGRLSDYLKENVKVSVLLKQNVSERAARSFETSVSSCRYVKSTEYISQEQGIAEMRELLGENFMDVFEVSPIPISIDLSLYPAYIHPDSLEIVRRELLSNDIVSEVSYQRGVIDSLNSNIRKISIVIAVFIALLLFISIVLISGTVRLNVYAHRFSIHTMKLVGATNGFIRKPFLAQALVQGLISSLLALLMLIGIMYYLRSEIVQLFQVFPLDLVLEVIAIVVATGVLICLLTSSGVVNRLVKLKKEELYY